MRPRIVTQAQFELMLSFMEKHSDMIPNPNDGSPQTRLEALQHWLQLVDLLNDKSVGEPKTIEKWRKCWSDLKNNTKKKALRLQTKEGIHTSDLTDIERRVLKLIAKNNPRNRVIESENGDSDVIKLEVDQRYRRPLPDPCFYEENEEVPTRRRKQSTCSEASTSSSNTPPAIKRKKQTEESESSSKTNSIDDITARYLEFEREREKMAHEREMERIRQNDHFYSILSRFVKVMENIAPSIQKYVESKCNE